VITVYLEHHIACSIAHAAARAQRQRPHLSRNCALCKPSPGKWTTELDLPCCAGSVNRQEAMPECAVAHNIEYMLAPTFCCLSAVDRQYGWLAVAASGRVSQNDGTTAPAPRVRCTVPHPRADFMHRSLALLHVTMSHSSSRGHSRMCSSAILRRTSFACQSRSARRECFSTVLICTTHSQATMQ
jgi:hypothetical protein